MQSLAVIAIPAASAVYTWIATRDKDNSQHIKAVETALGERIAEHEIRIERVEGDIKHMPSSVEMLRIAADLKAAQTAQEAALREMHGMRMAINRIEDFLLKK
ncbi:MAG: hypothetical protein Fur0019_16110 [Tibeticola sp.]